MNAAFLGLSLLADDLKQSSRPEDIERCETLHDVQFSCTTALDILNDLLTFEKLESGILELHQQEVELKGFLLDCVNMFSAQAKATHVRLEFRNLNELKTSTAASTSTASDARYGTPQLAPAMDSELTIEGGAMGCVPPPSSSSSSPASASVSYRSRTGGALPIENTDVISVDRFKMAQVIRNLLSNALKFTSAEGSVTVTACFIPNDTIFTFRSERTNTQAALVIPTGNHRDAATSGNTMRLIANAKGVALDYICCYKHRTKIHTVLQHHAIFTCMVTICVQMSSTVYSVHLSRRQIQSPLSRPVNFVYPSLTLAQVSALRIRSVCSRKWCSSIPRCSKQAVGRASGCISAERSWTYTKER